MPRRTLEDLHREHGTQPAAYIEDFIRAKGGHLITCRQCHRQYVVEFKPTKREATEWRCGECAPRATPPGTMR